MWALALFCMMPLVWPQIPPLVDLPGHMVSYKLQLEHGESAALRQWYNLGITAMGNLGVQMLIPPLAKLFGLELAVKLIVTAIPATMALGFLWVSREVHGRIPPTTLFALPLVYSYPFIFGFVNFAMSMALCFVAFGLWLWLGRLERYRLRAALFVPIALFVWLAHVFGWGVLCVLIFASEAMRAHDGGRRPIAALLRAVILCLPLAPPAAVSLWWAAGVGGGTGGWFAIIPKTNYILHALRDRWIWIDVPSILIVLALVITPFIDRRFAYARVLAAPAAVMILLYLLLPQRALSSAYADMRLMPFALATILIALKPPTQYWRPLAIGGLAFLGVRMVSETASFALYSRSWQNELAALDHVPRGARLVSFVGTRCRGEWTMARLEHLPGMATVRREAFSNDQWSVENAQINRVAYAPAGPFGRDPSQVVRLNDCPVNRWPTLDMSLRRFPRHAFDYVWLINPPHWDKRLTAGMVPVWTNGHSVLFRIVDRTQPQPLPTDMLPATL